VLGGVQLIAKTIFLGIGADPQVAIAEPDVIQIAEAIDAAELGAEVLVVVAEQSDIAVDDQTPTLAKPLVVGEAEQHVEAVFVGHGDSFIYDLCTANAACNIQTHLTVHVPHARQQAHPVVHAPGGQKVVYAGDQLEFQLGVDQAFPALFASGADEYSLLSGAELLRAKVRAPSCITSR